MESEIINKINVLRAQGYGYRRIAGLLELSAESVKKYCQRHPAPVQEERGHKLCPQCGMPLIQAEYRKKKRFCSDKCRAAWWRKHGDEMRRKTLHTHICLHCGEAFKVYGTSDRKFCSRACYADYRRKGN